MKQTAVEFLEEKIKKYSLDLIPLIYVQEAKEMEKQQRGYSEEEILHLLEMLEKCHEYFLLKTDAKSDERADAIGQAIEDFKKIKSK
jgi:cell division septum initiation protein DivIVA